MKLFKKISIFASFTLVLSLVFSVCAFATEVSKETKPENFNERLEYAIQGTVTGMLMIFAVLTLLTLILYFSKVVFYDIPKKRREKNRNQNEVNIENFKTDVSAPTQQEPIAEEPDNTELAAVITAAIAAMLEDEEYAEQFKSGFRVVSFKRADNPGAWNKK